MDRIQLCYLSGDTGTTATVADALASRGREIALHTVGSHSAARELFATESIDCVLCGWIDSKTDRESFLDVCRRQTVAVVWLTDQPTATAETLESDGFEYISTADAESGRLLAHRIRSAVDASKTRRRVDEPRSTAGLANGTSTDATQSIETESQIANGEESTTTSSTEIVDRSQAGILVFDAEGLITRLNPAAEELLGLPAAEAIGNSCETLDMRTAADRPIPQADRPAARVLETGEPIYDSVVSVPDQTGGRRWLSISASPLANGQTVDGVVVTLEDVSEAVELETTLETVLDRMTDGFIAFDTELRLTYFSKQAIDTDRYPDIEYLGLRLADLGAHLEQYDVDLQEVLETQEPKTVETYVPAPTDEWIRARLYPSETGVSVFFSEVTAEKQRERKLQQYKTIVESVQDGVCILNADSEFVFVNDAFSELVGYDADELLGRNAALVTDTEDMEIASERREQLLAGDTEAAILSGEVTTKSGQRTPAETWMTPIELVDGEMGTVGVVRDLSFRKQTETQFTALYNGAHELLSAHSKETIAEITIDAASSVLGFEDAIVLGYDSESNVFRALAATQSTEQNVPELLPIAADATSIAGRAYFESECIASDDMSELSGLYDPETPYRRALFIPLSDHGVLFVGDTECGSTSEQTLTVAELLGTTVSTAFDRLAADQQSQAHRQTVAEQTAELAALNHTNELLAAFSEQLFSAQSREEVETIVCSILTAFEQYSFAWIGAADDRTESVVPRVSDGTENGYLDWLETHLAERPESVDEPAVRALDSNAPVSVEQVSRSWKQAPWRKEALSRGYQSVFSIPLRHNRISYGALSVYANTPDAFNEHIQTVLGSFGRIIAYVIAGTETKQGLLADRRTELDVEITESHDILHRLATRLSTALRFEGVVPQRDDQSLLFFAVDELPAETVETAAAELCSIDSLRVVTEQNGTTLYQASVSGSTLARTLVDCGVIPTAIETDGERQRAAVTLPESTEVRTFMERLKATYPSSTVVSRQSRQEGPQTRATFQMQLIDGLTKRQAETLRAAYFARYFESPRGSTGTEVGASLGISQPTFNYHLRAALRTLLGLLFDREPAETLDT